jgi:hypothetical protein
MRYALFLSNSSVLGDCLAHQARRASGSTVVPSQLFASRPGRKLGRRPQWAVDVEMAKMISDSGRHHLQATLVLFRFRE